MLATVVGHDEETKKNLPELKSFIIGGKYRLRG